MGRSKAQMLQRLVQLLKSGRLDVLLQEMASPAYEDFALALDRKETLERFRCSCLSQAIKLGGESVLEQKHVLDEFFVRSPLETELTALLQLGNATLKQLQVLRASLHAEEAQDPRLSRVLKRQRRELKLPEKQGEETSSEEDGPPPAHSK